MEQLIGQIAIYPWDWAPRNWAKCDGQTLLIEHNYALYALIGNEFGGDGDTTFAVPKLPPIKVEGGGDLAYYVALQGYYPPRD